MYNSPIKMLISDIQNQIVKQQDEQIYRAIVNVIPNIDEDELIRALQYDRNQYEKGYADGKQDVMDGLVQCKDCDYSEPGKIEGCYVCHYWSPFGEALVPADGYCFRGETK